MIPLLSLALAAEPAAPPEPVVAIRCARPVELTTPYRWSWSAERPLLTRLTALVIEADPELLRPRDVGQRVLYVDGWPVEPLLVDGGAALVLAPSPLGDTPIRAWFGDETLPEKVDAPHRAAMVAAAATLAPLHLPAPAPALTLAADEPAPRTVLVATLTTWWRDGCPR